MSPGTPQQRGRPVIRCFPSADRSFAAEVARFLDELPDASTPDAAVDLERLVKRRYPAARVTVQDPLASFGGAGDVWYVYRRDAPATHADGATETAGSPLPPSPVPSSPPGDALTATADGAPDADTGADPANAGHGSRPVYSVAATAAMIGVPIAILVGWDEADLVRPTTTAARARLYSRDDLEDLLAVKRAITAGQTPDEARDVVAAARQRRRAGPFGAGGGGRKVLVLLAERDPYAAEMAEYFLRTEGYDVEVAFSVPEAESRAGERVPDVSIVDLLISGGAGAELCARLKAQAGSAVVAISTLDLEDAAIRAGADAFLSKPLDPLQLISTIKDLLGESAMLRGSKDQ